MYGSWDTRHDKQFFVILGHFLPFDPPNNMKNQSLKKWKNYLKILSFYTCVPQLMNVWCMVPEIWSATDRIFCHFGQFFAPSSPLTTQKIKNLRKWKNTWRYHHFTQVYHNWQSYDVWFLRYEVWKANFFWSFWAIFCPFTPLTTQKINIMKRRKKILEISFYTSVYT